MVPENPGDPQVDVLIPDAAGQSPGNPWDWIEMEPIAGGAGDIFPFINFGIVTATENVKGNDEKELFSAFEMTIQQGDPEEKVCTMWNAGNTECLDPFTISFSSVVKKGPTVTLVGLKNGDVLADGQTLALEASILRNISQLDKIIALVNGNSYGTPTYTGDSSSGDFLWDLSGWSVQEGDRICVGAESTTGHATINLLEFAEVSGGLLIAVTITPDEDECSPPADSPFP